MISSAPEWIYAYDSNGNTLTDAGGKTYTWDFENRLVSAMVPSTRTVSFKYDPFGRRIQKSSASGSIRDRVITWNCDRRRCA
jgi:YD repeat-containing protein